jgi:hypothetical protein
VANLVAVVELAYQSTTSSTSAVAERTTGPAPHRLPLTTIGSARSGLEVSAPDANADEQLVVLLVITTLYVPVIEDENVVTFPGLVNPEGTVQV